MATDTTLQLHSQRGATLRLVAIGAIVAALTVGFLASVWDAPAPPRARDANEPAEQAPAPRPVAMR